MVVLAGGCLAAAEQKRGAGGNGALPAGRLALALDAMEPFLGPEVACGQSFQAELLRMRGDLLLARDGLAASVDAPACFEQALQLGREQGALAWQLRAAMSLVRLQERQILEQTASGAKLEEGPACLRRIYARFTEGFDFSDLRDAAALIATPP